MTTERRLRSKCAAQVETLPEGKLSVQIVKGRTYYTLVKKGKRQYIGAGNRELVEKLQLRRYLEKMIASIDHNEGYLREFFENYRPVAPEDVLESLRRRTGTGSCRLWRGRALICVRGRRRTTSRRRGTGNTRFTTRQRVIWSAQNPSLSSRTCCTKGEFHITMRRCCTCQTAGTWCLTSPWE